MGGRGDSAASPGGVAEGAFEDEALQEQEHSAVRLRRPLPLPDAPGGWVRKTQLVDDW